MKFLDRIKLFLSRGNRYHLLSVVIIFFFAAVVTYTNLGLVKSFIGDDAGVIYHFPSTELNLATSMWDSYTFPGRSNVIATLGLAHAIFANILSDFGLTSVIADRMFYFLCYFIPGLGMYFLSYHICNQLSDKNKAILWLVSLIAALFYMFNNLTMILLSFPPTVYIYSYILLPWIFLLYLKDFHLADQLWKRIIFSVVFLLLLSGNPSNTITIVVFLLIYELFFKRENKIINNWKKFATTVVLIILLSSYIFLPTLGNKDNPYGVVVGNDASISFNSVNTSIGNLLRLLGHPAQENFVFNRFLLSNKSITANYLILIFSLLFMLKRKIGKSETFLFLTFLLFVFLAKANHPPLESVNRWLFNNIPFFEMYRASYFKFILFALFSLSMLLSISLLALYDKMLDLKFHFGFKVIVLILPFLTIIYSALPFFQGQVANEIHKTLIPREYKEARQFFKNQDADFSILSLPQAASGATLDFGDGNYFGSGGNPDPYLLGRPVWTNGWFLPGTLVSDQFSSYKNLLSKSNVRYILLHKDIPEKYYFSVGIRGAPLGQTRYKNLLSQISSDPDWNLLEDNKLFMIFELKEEKITQHFNLPEKIVTSENTPDTLLDNQNTWPADSVVFLVSQNKNKTDVIRSLQSKSESSDVQPYMEFRKISQNKYRVVIHSTKKQFPLIFNEGFQNGWKIYLDKPVTTASSLRPTAKVTENVELPNGRITDTWFKSPIISSEAHLESNGYGNAWAVDPEQVCFSDNRCVKNSDGTYDMNFLIEFWPQRLFYLGVGISVTTLLLSAYYSMYILVRRKRINV